MNHKGNDRYVHPEEGCQLTSDKEKEECYYCGAKRPKDEFFLSGGKKGSVCAACREHFTILHNRGHYEIASEVTDMMVCYKLDVTFMGMVDICSKSFPVRCADFTYDDYIGVYKFCKLLTGNINADPLSLDVERGAAK